MVDTEINRTNTYSPGNAYFSNQGRGSIRQENNDMYNRETAHKYQEQALRVLPTSIKIHTHNGTSYNEQNGPD